MDLPPESQKEGIGTERPCAGQQGNGRVKSLESKGLHGR